MDTAIYTSAIYSAIIQFVIGIICILGTFIKLDTKDQLLSEILLLETIVQGVEFIFYVWLIFNFSNISGNVTLIRYLDWFITTPTMLLSTICILVYLQTKNTHQLTNSLSIQNIYSSNTSIINTILASNAIMLLLGYLGELQKISKNIGFVIGTIFLGIAYYSIYANFVDSHFISNSIFWFSFIIWSLYGVAYLLSFTNKNIMYSILDIFSKNVNGLLLLLFIIYTKYGESYSKLF